MKTPREVELEALLKSCRLVLKAPTEKARRLIIAIIEEALQEKPVYSVHLDD